MELKFSRQIFEKSPNIKFHKNPSNGSRCSMRTDRWTITLHYITVSWYGTLHMKAVHKDPGMCTQPPYKTE